VASKSLTPKQEAFARFVSEGDTLAGAYRKAYNAENMQNNSIHVNASQIMADTKISLRVAELQELAAERTLVTIESLTAELDEDRQLARNEGQASAAISAVMGKAKLNGLLKDKLEHTGQIVQRIERTFVDTPTPDG